MALASIVVTVKNAKFEAVFPLAIAQNNFHSKENIPNEMTFDFPLPVTSSRISKRRHTILKKSLSYFLQNFPFVNPRDMF